MSKIIWKDLDDGKQVVGNQITRSEFDIIKSYSNKLILGKLGQNTILSNATKNKLGYCLYRCCAKSLEENCESKFRVYMIYTLIQLHSALINYAVINYIKKKLLLKIQ